jgi:alkanesulfonate monooxygenase SsuD/methylene tetrahydromethanopterin reductase-like flavin-dependent oxidoreductase (luciferase family)
VKIGVQLPEVERQVPWSELRAMSRLIEDGGLDSVWVGDHVIYHRGGRWIGPWEAWTTMAAIAAVTDRIEIGPLVAPTAFSPPMVLAKRAATLDEISNGRFVLGLGAGSDETDFNAVGVPFTQRAGRFEEAFTIIRTLFERGEIDFEGQFHTVINGKLHPTPPTEGGPPIMIGSIGPRVLKATLPHVARWNAWFMQYDNDPETAAGLLQWIDEQAELAGRTGLPVEKALCSLFQFGDEPLRHGAKNALIEPDAQLAALDGFREIGVDHLHLILDP